MTALDQKTGLMKRNRSQTLTYWQEFLISLINTISFYRQNISKSRFAWLSMYSTTCWMGRIIRHYRAGINPAMAQRKFSEEFTMWCGEIIFSAFQREILLQNCICNVLPTLRELEFLHWIISDYCCNECQNK